MDILKKIIRRFFAFQHDDCVQNTSLQNTDKGSIFPERITHRQMIMHLLTIPCWKQKIEFYQEYQYVEASGAWILQKCVSQYETISDSNISASHKAETCHAKIHYGCGGNIMDGWLNVDLHESDASNYRRINLIEKHPFLDNTFLFAYAEDVLEHLSQAESIFFLAEIYRTLATDGVARLSFPGLEAVLRRHYSPLSEKRVREAEFEAYSFWDHIHFYSQEEVRLVAKHVGFRRIEFVEYGKSRYPELCGLDTRSEQIDLNIIVELTK